MSNSIQIGRVRPFKSDQYDWKATYQYEILELVRYDTTTYLCIKVPPKGTLPTNEDYFIRLGSDVSVATDTDTGLVKADGTTITVDTDGTISVASVPSSTLPTATTSALGGVKVDGSSITISNGVISTTNIAGVKTWVTTTAAGTKTYQFTGEALPSANTNEYILAYGAAVLDPEDYTINTTNNSITLGTNTDTAGLKLRLYHFRSGYAEADSSNYWSVQQQSIGIVDQSFLSNNAISTNLSITKQTPSAVTMTTSGARSVTVTAASINESKFITLVLRASAATTITWNGITKWVDKDEAAPSWGNSGATLIVQIALVGGVVLASTLYNSQA